MGALPLAIAISILFAAIFAWLNQRPQRRKRSGEGRNHLRILDD
jgi:hypothetical protein